MLAGEDEDWPPWLFVNSNDCLFSLSELNLANIIQVMHGLLKPYMNADLFNRAPGKFLSRDATFKLTGRSTGEAEGYVFYMGDWHDVVWYGAVLHPNSANELIPADMRLARRLKRLGKEGVHMPRMPPCLPLPSWVGTISLLTLNVCPQVRWWPSTRTLAAVAFGRIKPRPRIRPCSSNRRCVTFSASAAVHMQMASINAR